MNFYISLILKLILCGFLGYYISTILLTNITQQIFASAIIGQIVGSLYEIIREIKWI